MTVHYDKGGVIVRDANINDIDLWEIDPYHQMRPLEVSEVWASHHLRPKEAVSVSCLDSVQAFTIIHDYHLVGMFGIVPDSLIGERAQVWLLTTEEIYNMRIRFLKLTRHFIDEMRKSYPVLYNWVDARNEQCVRWLKWAGAEVFPPETHGVDKMPFHYFVLGGR